MKKTENCGAIILAGGKSERMRLNKALLPLRRHTLIEAIILSLRELFSEILISASQPGTYEFLGHRVICDENRDLGPLAAIHTSLKAASMAANFVIACDIPDVRIPLIESLLSRARDCSIVVPRHADGKYEPLFAVYNRSIIPAIEEQMQSGDLKIASLYAKCPTAYIEIEGNYRFPNLNTLQDYREFLQASPERFPCPRAGDRT
jgi:molybdopterin-guanine dinucleotide biosynthesis protein A